MAARSRRALWPSHPQRPGGAVPHLALATTRQPALSPRVRRRKAAAPLRDAERPKARLARPPRPQPLQRVAAARPGDGHRWPAAVAHGRVHALGRQRRQGRAALALLLGADRRQQRFHCAPLPRDRPRLHPRAAASTAHTHECPPPTLSEPSAPFPRAASRGQSPAVCRFNGARAH